MTTEKAQRTHAARESLSVSQVGNLLNVSKPTVYALIHEGVLDSFFVGRLRRVPGSSLDKYIDKQLAAAAPVQTVRKMYSSKIESVDDSTQTSE